MSSSTASAQTLQHQQHPSALGSDSYQSINPQFSSNAVGNPQVNNASNPDSATLQAILALGQSVQQMAFTMSVTAAAAANNKTSQLVDAFMENNMTQLENSSLDHFTAKGSTKFLQQLVAAWLQLFQTKFKWPMEDYLLKFDKFMATIDRTIEDNEKLYVFMRTYFNFLNNAAIMGVFSKDIRTAITINHVKLFKDWRHNRFNPVTEDFKTLHDYPILIFRCTEAKSDMIAQQNGRTDIVFQSGNVDKIRPTPSPWAKAKRPKGKMVKNTGYF